MGETCHLDALLGTVAACPKDRCPFWEPGGAVLEGRCAFDRLDLARRPAVVSELLRVREELKVADDGEERGAAQHAFHRLLNESGEQ